MHNLNKQKTLTKQPVIIAISTGKYPEIHRGRFDFPEDSPQ